MKTTHLNPRQITIQQAVEVYNMSEETLRGYIRRGLVPHRRVGRRIYLPVDQFEAWLSRGDVEPQGERA